MYHIRNSKTDSIFLLEHEGIPTTLLTDFSETIKNGSICVDTTNNDIYQLRNDIWIKMGVSYPLILNNDPINNHNDPTFIGELAINTNSGEVYVANGTNSWVAITDGSRDSSNTASPIPIIKSHEELINLQNSNALIPNQKYQMYFLTVHNILHTDILNIDSPFFVPIPENLIITAQSTNTFFEDIKSIEFPNDKIKFDFNNIWCEDGTNSRIGLITYREDPTINVSAYYDWRNVMFRRWSIDKNKYQSFTSIYPQYENEIAYKVDTEETGVWEMIFDQSLFPFGNTSCSIIVFNDSVVAYSNTTKYNVIKNVWKPIINIRSVDIYAENTSGSYTLGNGYVDTLTFMLSGRAGGLDSVLPYRNTITSFDRKTFQYVSNDTNSYYTQAKRYYQDTILDTSNINIGKTIKNFGYNNITIAGYSGTVNNFIIDDESYDMHFFQSYNIYIGKYCHDINVYASNAVYVEDYVSNSNLFRSSTTNLKRNSNNNISKSNLGGSILNIDGKYNTVYNSSNIDIEYNTANNAVFNSYQCKIYPYCTDNKFRNLEFSTIQDNCTNNILVGKSYEKYQKVIMESQVKNCYWSANMKNVKIGYNSDNIDIGSNSFFSLETIMTNIEIPQRSVSLKTTNDRYQGTSSNVDYLYDFVGNFKDIDFGNALEFSSGIGGFGFSSSQGYVSPLTSYPSHFYQKLNIPSSELIENSVNFSSASTSGYILYDGKIFLQEIYLMDYISDVTLYYKPEGSSIFTLLGTGNYTNGDKVKLDDYNTIIKNGSFSVGKWVLKLVVGSSSFPLSGSTETGVFVKHYKYKI